MRSLTGSLADGVLAYEGYSSHFAVILSVSLSLCLSVRMTSRNSSCFHGGKGHQTGAFCHILLALYLPVFFFFKLCPLNFN